MKKIVLFIFLLASLSEVFSQTDPQITQYMLYPTSFNPAAVGENDVIQVSGIHHMMWMNMQDKYTTQEAKENNENNNTGTQTGTTGTEKKNNDTETRNAGSTTFFQINAPFKIKKTRNGIGLQFKNDKIGLFNYQTIHLQYAYKTRLAGGQLSIGTNLGVINAGFRGNEIYIPEGIGEYHKGKSEDPFLNTLNEVTGTTFDMGLGIWYSKPKYYAGISYLSLTNPTVEWTDKNSYQMFGTFYATGGYNFQLYNPKFVITPSVLVKTNFTATMVDVSSLLKYDERFWGGLAYRWTESIGVLLGANIIEGLSAGYSYDIPMKGVAGWGSHEIFVRYEFALAGKNKNKHKSVRIL